MELIYETNNKTYKIDIKLVKKIESLIRKAGFNRLAEEVSLPPAVIIQIWNSYRKRNGIPSILY